MEIVSTDYKFNVIEVEWWDAFHGTSPLEVAELICQPKLLVKSVGYKLFEDDV